MDGEGKYTLKITGRDEEAPQALVLFNHFLQQVARHGLQDLGGRAESKDGLVHHLYEDTSIVLGQAYRKAFGDKAGISRVSYLKWPFERCVGEMAVDLSGRGGDPDFETEIRDSKLSEMAYHVILSLSRESGIDIYARTSGWSDHHQLELLGKLLGRNVYNATRRLESYTEPLSTKGTLG